MFYSITGKIVYVDTQSVAIETGGIAFRCSTTLTTLKRIGEKGNTATLYTYLNVREDALDLFGFADEQELECFKLLIGVSGVGPKAALAILSRVLKWQMRDLLVEILEEGVRSQAFFVTDIPSTAQMLIRFYMQFTDEMAMLLAQEDSEEKILESMVIKLQVYRTAVERILVAPFGSIVLCDAKELRLLLQDVIKRRLRERADEMLRT